MIQKKNSVSFKKKKSFCLKSKNMEHIEDEETIKKILRFFRSKRNLTSKEVDHEVAEMRISRYVLCLF